MTVPDYIPENLFELDLIEWEGHLYTEEQYGDIIKLAHIGPDVEF